jgi:hypothetical protein
MATLGHDLKKSKKISWRHQERKSSSGGDDESAEEKWCEQFFYDCICRDKD